MKCGYSNSDDLYTKKVRRFSSRVRWLSLLLPIHLLSQLLDALLLRGRKVQNKPATGANLENYLEKQQEN